MIKYIKPQELLTTPEFVREPVDNLSKKLKESSSKKIILNGGRGTGKSTVLYNLEHKGIETREPTIYTQFDSVINFSITPNEVFNEAFFEHYYELCFSWKLLRFIENNYPLNYEKYFQDIERLLKTMSEELDRNIRSAGYNGLSLNRYLSSTEISAKILTRLNYCLRLSSCNLAIDRFDWTNGRSAFSQQILSRYFDLFDKTIITSDDETLDDVNRRKQLDDKGYSFITTNYGNDIEIVKQIINKRILLSNINSKIKFDITKITDEIYIDLIQKTSGNISSMLASINEVINLSKWYNGMADINDLFDSAIEEELSKAKQLKKITTPTRLYL